MTNLWALVIMKESEKVGQRHTAPRPPFGLSLCAFCRCLHTSLLAYFAWVLFSMMLVIQRNSGHPSRQLKCLIPQGALCVTLFLILLLRLSLIPAHVLAHRCTPCLQKAVSVGGGTTTSRFPSFHVQPSRGMIHSQDAIRLHISCLCKRKLLVPLINSPLHVL